MSVKRKTANSAVLIMILTVGSKLVGFIREMLIAAKFGSGVETDTFFVALTATSLIGSLISATIGTTFVPILSEIETKEGKEGKNLHVNNLINIVMILSGVFVILGYFFAPVIVKLTASGFTGDQFNLAVKLTRIGLPIILTTGVLGSFRAYLESEDRHAINTIAGYALNFSYIFFLLFLADMFGIVGMMIAVVIGSFLQIAVKLPVVHTIGYRFLPVFDVKDKYIKKVLWLAGPILLGVAINDINAIVDKTLASQLIEGSISALNYASRINTLVLTIFVTAITTVIFPIMSREFNRGNKQEIVNIIRYGVNLILIVTIPATIGMMVLATPIVEVIFLRGAFTQDNVTMTSIALIGYAVGLVGMSIRLIASRAYYAFQDSKTVMTNSAITVGMNIILNLVLMPLLGIGGLALATSISVTISTVVLFYGLKKQLGQLGLKQYLTIAIKCGLASLAMGAVSYLVYTGIISILPMSNLYNAVALFVAVGVGAIVYSVLCYVLKVDEVRNVVSRIKVILMRKRKQ